MFGAYISLFISEIVVSDIGDSALKKFWSYVLHCFFIHFNRPRKIFLAF
jgi:hypothetical protein